METRIYEIAAHTLTPRLAVSRSRAIEFSAIHHVLGWFFYHEQIEILH